jgi:Uma2 family endonuclease
MISTQIRPLTNSEYHQMIKNGIIGAGERVELILGQIFTMAAKGTRHTVATTKLLKIILELVADRAVVRCQDPITLPNNSEPEPDIVIARLRSDDYLDSHPEPADLVLVIEVADTTIKFDRETKAPLYAAAQVQEYWIVNLMDDRLEIYRQPENNIYTSIEILTPPRSISLPQLTDAVLYISDCLPGAQRKI